MKRTYWYSTDGEYTYEFESSWDLNDELDRDCVAEDAAAELCSNDFEQLEHTPFTIYLHAAPDEPPVASFDIYVDWEPSFSALECN